MKILKSTIMMIALTASSVQMQAQNCLDLYERANSLRDSKKYGEAITYYQRAKACDPNLAKDCNKRIEFCRRALPVLEISKQEIRIPYQGGDSKIEVKSTGKWRVDGSSDWCQAADLDNKKFIIKCREANNSTRNKTTTLMVKSGSIYKSVKVVQEGRPEYIEAGAKSLTFPAKGTEDHITIESNANWHVTPAPPW